jgi:hypothetical protein
MHLAPCYFETYEREGGGRETVLSGVESLYRLSRRYSSRMRGHDIFGSNLLIPWRNRPVLMIQSQAVFS